MQHMFNGHMSALMPEKSCLLVKTFAFKGHLFLPLSLLLLCGCQTSTVAWKSDPPGAYASGRYRDGTTYRQPLPFTITYASAELPKDFPATCGVVNSPTITWPDGVKKDSERVRICYKENSYISVKPPQASPPPTYTPPSEIRRIPTPDRQERTQSAPAKASPSPIQDAEKKCLRIGLSLGSDDYNLCINSAK
jgi:hypothetical protein